MSADVYRLNGDDAVAVEAAVAALKRGELVVIPTETVYGLVADASVPGAVERIYAAKERDRGKALQLLVSGVDAIASMGYELSESERKLADRFWPGGLTLVVEKDGSSEGFRVPDSGIALEIVRRVGGVLRSTSANTSGEPAAQTADDAIEYLGDAVAVVLDGGMVQGGVASSVVRVGDDGIIEVLREGAVSGAELRIQLERHA
jgi:tRNA threonylcarbamoyl adenosine modification protein (Sua5/YciO/YrdC/YwlC family)